MLGGGLLRKIVFLLLLRFGPLPRRVRLRCGRRGHRPLRQSEHAGVAALDLDLPHVAVHAQIERSLIINERFNSGRQVAVPPLDESICVELARVHLCIHLATLHKMQWRLSTLSRHFNLLDDEVGHQRLLRCRTLLSEGYLV